MDNNNYGNYGGNGYGGNNYSDNTNYYYNQNMVSPFMTVIVPSPDQVDRVPLFPGDRKIIMVQNSPLLVVRTLSTSGLMTTDVYGRIEPNQQNSQKQQIPQDTLVQNTSQNNESINTGLINDIKQIRNLLEEFLDVKPKSTDRESDATSSANSTNK